jgi:hypothetical protein
VAEETDGDAAGRLHHRGLTPAVRSWNVSPQFLSPPPPPPPPPIFFFFFFPPPPPPPPPFFSRTGGSVSWSSGADLCNGRSGPRDPRAPPLSRHSSAAPSGTKLLDARAGAAVERSLVAGGAGRWATMTVGDHPPRPVADPEDQAPARQLVEMRASAAA